MSDYGDDSDYELDWIWIEEEYSAADDLAEHAVQSPGPAMNLDEDDIADWDRFDYFNDLEYASDGYDDVTFAPHKSEAAKNGNNTGQKRKRNGVGRREKKRARLAGEQAASLSEPGKLVLPPIAWRSQEQPHVPVVSDESLESYALLKDWRASLPEPPAWATKFRVNSKHGKNTSESSTPALTQMDDTMDDADEGEDQGEDSATIDPSLLLAALQKNLAEAGGPLSEMDPQQLLQFAMRMMDNVDNGDDIAGELADHMLNQGHGEDGEDEDEGDEEGRENPTDLLAWLARSRNQPQGNNDTQSNEHGCHSHKPPSPPSSEKTRDIQVAGEHNEAVKPDQRASRGSTAVSGTSPQATSRKRKADAIIETPSTAVPKKRATRSHDEPTTASQTRSIPTPRSTRSGRANRS